LDRPIRGFTFDRALVLVLGRHEKVGPNVFFGKIVSRQNFRLAHEFNSFAIGDRLTAEHDSHVSRAIAHVNPMAGIAMDRHTLLGDVTLHNCLLSRQSLFQSFQLFNRFARFQPLKNLRLQSDETSDSGATTGTVGTKWNSRFFS
jgi:hypothetical protein